MKILLVSGGTASGKTTFANKLSEMYGDGANTISMDMFYPELDLEVIKIEEHDFDHPKALDVKLFLLKMKELKENKTVKIPLHDFATTTVTHDHTHIPESEVVIIEGMMVHTILNDMHDLLEEKDFLDINMTKKEVEEFCKNFLKESEKIFVKVVEGLEDYQHRTERRIKRDLIERDRTPEQTIKMLKEKAHPAHAKHVAPQEEICNHVVLEKTFEHKLKDIVKKLKTSNKKNIPSNHSKRKR